MKVWASILGTARTGWVDIELGQEVTVFRTSRAMNCFGERAHLTRATKRHLVFTTESGSEVKTKVDNLFITVGKMSDYSVSLKKFEDFHHIVKERVSYWNNDKCKFEYK